jgi:hypothetical protein
MGLRNFNNTTTVGALASPVSSSALSATVTGFSNYPAVPFTVTVDRNTVTEEICLVTAVNSGVLTWTRGYNGTAAQSHTAGGSVEHTAIAADFTEANGHVNATASVHGTAGELVGAEGAQTILDKTMIATLFEADPTMGDALVAYVPDGAEARNLLRGMDPNGDDVLLVDASGNLTAHVVHATGNSETDGNHVVDGTLTVGGTATAAAPTTGAHLTTKTYVDGLTTPLGTRVTTAEGTLTAATATAGNNTLVKRNGTGNFEAATPTTAAHVATKGYADSAVAAKSQRGSTGLTFSNDTFVAGSITFPTAFATAPTVMLSVQVPGNTDFVAVLAGAPSATGFSYRVRERGGTAVTATAQLHWFATL